ncbi:diguanylate cyclase domain-containing protein [Vibrio mangrovi]|uniref:diguanylate cyclase n=1 Tax=Vibrio mangrovi TaxID=474394 RepID=A0A1Y6IRK9_9VIBR|nr:diguanylate cyclase [Vibrio mangrovi]MDW6001715.1 diguanylate cyclase [Vibrio mangrovi]SMS00258.1 Phytochrome-like protein cph2 [Vibrio mangrovi]
MPQLTWDDYTQLEIALGLGGMSAVLIGIVLWMSYRWKLRHLHSIFTHAPCALLMMSRKSHQILFANELAQHALQLQMRGRLLQFSPWVSSSLRKHFSELIDKSYQDHTRQFIDWPVGEDSSVQLEFLAKETVFQGQTAWMIQMLIHHELAEATGESGTIRESELMQQLWDSAPDAIAIIQEDGCCRSCNLSFAHLVGQDDVSDVIGQRLTWVAQEPFFRQLFELTEKDTDARQPIRYIDHLEKEQRQWFDIAKSVYRSPASNQVLALLIVRNISAWYSGEETEQTLNAHRISSFDQLTGIVSRNRFDETLETLWHIHIREKQPLAVILCDVDCFDSYNQYYGDDKGNETLCSVALALQRVMSRSSDCIARYDGDTFAFILPNTHIDGACWVAEKIHSEFKQVQLPHPVSDVSSYVTVSMGIVSLVPKANELPDQFVAYAGQALHQAKIQGRNRTCVYYESLGRK